MRNIIVVIVIFFSVSFACGMGFPTTNLQYNKPKDYINLEILDYDKSYDCLGDTILQIIYDNLPHSRDLIPDVDLMSVMNVGDLDLIEVHVKYVYRFYGDSLNKFEVDGFDYSWTNYTKGIKCIYDDRKDSVIIFRNLYENPRYDVMVKSSIHNHGSRREKMDSALGYIRVLIKEEKVIAIEAVFCY